MKPPLVNDYGRQLDDLDTVRLRVLARELVGERSFSVQAEDGAPMCGYVSDNRGPVKRLTATGWRTRSKS